MSDSSAISMDLRVERDAFRLECCVELPAHGISALFGPSGSGKTTLLRAIAGLERSVSGRLTVGGEVWMDSESGLCLPTWRRPIGLVFQEPSLLPHLDVGQNILLGAPRGARLDDRSLGTVIELLGITSLLAHRPTQLSGGEQQRVAIARAIACRPTLLLLDEPLSALDPARREEVLPWLERLRAEHALPMLYVSHQVSEVLRLADHVLLLEHGRLAASGPVRDLLPALGQAAPPEEDRASLLFGSVTRIDDAWQLAEVKVDRHGLWLSARGLTPGQSVRLRVAASDVSLARQAIADSSIQNQLPCRVESIHPAHEASQCLVELSLGTQRLCSRITARAAHQLGLAPGEPVWAQIKAAAVQG